MSSTFLKNIAVKWTEATEGIVTIIYAVALFWFLWLLGSFVDHSRCSGKAYPLEVLKNDGFPTHLLRFGVSQNRTPHNCHAPGAPRIYQKAYFWGPREPLSKKGYLKGSSQITKAVCCENTIFLKDKTEGCIGRFASLQKHRVPENHNVPHFTL